MDSTLPASPPFNLLVLGSRRTNYYNLFQEASINGRPIKVEHCAWDDLHLCSYGDNGGVVATMGVPRNPIPGTPQEKARSFTPHFVLLRAGCKGDARTDWRYKLSVLAHGNVPCINSIDSFFRSQDKAQLYGKLLVVKKRLGGHKNFPLVSQGCYSDWNAATFQPDVPCVAKVGTASGGLGKMRIESVEQWDDFRSIMPMQKQYFATEPFIPWVYDIRIQKIGNNYRCFRRTSKHWKSNVDISTKDEDIPLEARYKVWIDEAAHELGMDICAMDVLQDKEGKEWILECNSSAIGLNGRYQAEDDKHIRDLTLVKIKEYLESSQQKDEGKKDETQYSYETLLHKLASLEKELEHLRAGALGAPKGSPEAVAAKPGKGKEKEAKEKKKEKPKKL